MDMFFFFFFFNFIYLFIYLFLFIFFFLTDIDQGYSLSVDIFALGQEDMKCGFTYEYSLYVFFRVNYNPTFGKYSC